MLSTTTSRPTHRAPVSTAPPNNPRILTLHSSTIRNPNKKRKKTQQLIQTEMGARKRLLKAAGIQPTADATRSQGEHTTRLSRETSICKHGDGGDGSVNTRPLDKPALADDSRSVDGTGAWIGAGGGSGDGEGSGKKGFRHDLRVQMSIERKRARLFEDIQTLPYT